MRSILKSTAILGGGTLISLALGLVSAKVSAILLGPGGMGYLGLLQSAISLASLVGSIGFYGLVRALSRARAQEDLRREAALRKSGWMLCWGGGGVIMGLMIVLREPLGRLALGGVQPLAVVPLIGGTVLLTMAAGMHSSFLNAHQRVAELARYGVSNSIIGILTMLPLIALWRERGLPWALFFGAVASVLVAGDLARRRAPAPRVHVTADDVRASTRELVSFGFPFTASALVGTGVQLALPVFVLHMLGTNEVGFFRAATGVSAMYLGFLVAAMGQDYYPRVSAGGDQPIVLIRLINDQYRLVLLLAGPLILAMLALLPYLVPLVYSRQFAPTTALLEWQLIGDVFKFAGLTMAFVILAQRGSLVFFLTELAGGASLLLFSWLGMQRFGLEGLGGAFLLRAVVSYALCWMVLRRAIGLRLTTENTLHFTALVVSVFLVRALPYIGLEHARTPVALLLSAVAAAYSLHVIWGEVGGVRPLPASEQGQP